MVAPLHVRVCLGGHLVTSEELFLVSDKHEKAAAWVRCQIMRQIRTRFCRSVNDRLDTLCDQNDIFPWWVGKKSSHSILLIKGENSNEDNSSENLLGVF